MILEYIVILNIFCRDYNVASLYSTVYTTRQPLVGIYVFCSLCNNNRVENKNVDQMKKLFITKIRGSWTFQFFLKCVFNVKKGIIQEKQRWGALLFMSTHIPNLHLHLDLEISLVSEKLFPHAMSCYIWIRHVLYEAERSEA